MDSAVFVGQPALEPLQLLLDERPHWADPKLADVLGKGHMFARLGETKTNIVNIEAQQVASR